MTWLRTASILALTLIFVSIPVWIVFELKFSGMLFEIQRIEECQVQFELDIDRVTRLLNSATESYRMVNDAITGCILDSQKEIEKIQADQEDMRKSFEKQLGQISNEQAKLINAVNALHKRLIR